MSGEGFVEHDADMRLGLVTSVMIIGPMCRGHGILEFDVPMTKSIRTSVITTEVFKLQLSSL